MDSDKPVYPAKNLPCRSTSFYRSLAHSRDPNEDPIAAQFVPRAEEAHTEAYESTDPLADTQYLVSERLVHHYRDRVLLLATDSCAVYCRHCFRRHFTGSRRGAPDDTELERVARYLREHQEVHELLLSGGDPLTLPNAEIVRILSALRSARPELNLRICSRVPVVEPNRIDQELVQALTGNSLDIHAVNSVTAHDGVTPGATWFVTHANHPREVGPEFFHAVRKLQTGGIPVLNQAVLLRGVNDDTDTLDALFRALYRCGVKPYYLLQTDLAAGTSHFRVEISRGLELMHEIRLRLSGPAVPVYALDLPGGGGKVPIESALIRIETGRYVFRGPDDGEYSYPRHETAH